MVAMRLGALLKQKDFRIVFHQQEYGDALLALQHTNSVLLSLFQQLAFSCTTSSRSNSSSHSGGRSSILHHVSSNRVSNAGKGSASNGGKVGSTTAGDPSLSALTAAVTPLRPVPQVSSAKQSNEKRHKRKGRGTSSGRSGLGPRQLTVRIKSPDTNSPEVLLQLVQQHKADMNHIHLSAAYTQAVKVCQQGVPVQQQPAAVQELLSLLQQLAVMLHQQCGARELANIIWSCSRLCCADTAELLLPVFLQDSTLQQADSQNVSVVWWAVASMGQQLPAQQLQVMLQRFTELLHQANPQDVSNTLWAVATMGQQLPSQQLQALLQRMAELLPQATPQNISNTLWAVATMDWQLSAQQLQAILYRFAEVLPQANPQSVSNTLWAVADLGQQLPAQQLQMLLQRFAELLPQANPQAVSNTLWAVATMGQQVPAQQLQVLLQRFAELLPQAKPQDVSNTLWAVAAMGQQLPAQQLQVLLQRFTELLSQAKPQAVSNTLWAVATMGQRLPAQQLQPLLHRSTKLLPQAQPQDVSNTLWAYGCLHYAASQLMSALEQQPQQLQTILAGAKPQHLANLAWACGQLGQDVSKPLTRALLQQAVQDSNDTIRFNSQELCNLCWSAAVQDLQDCVPHVLQLAAACRQVWSTITSKGLRQLYQVHVWLQDKQLPSSAVGLLGVLSEEQLEQCRASWEQKLAASTAQSKASALQHSVFASLQLLPSGTWQQQPVMEQRTADGVFSIDIAATTAAGVRVAIEVDGPSHFVQPGNTLNGPSQSRDRALAARGYHVVSIPYWEWRRLRESDEQQAYLQCKLQGVLERP